MYALLAPLAGGLITLLNEVTSRFASHVGSLVSALVVHGVGLIAVSLVLLVKRERRIVGRLPIYSYLGGLVGVATVFSCNFAFSRLGASLAVSLALLGQTLFSLTVDATGFLGRRKYPLSIRSLPGIALALAGLALMAGNWRANMGAILVALLSGAFPILSISLNSELGRKIGVLHSARINFLVGLGVTLVLLPLLAPPLAATLPALKEAGPFLAIGGGIMGLMVVVGTSWIFPHLPAFTAVILMFSGQALTGVLIDAVALGSFEPRKLVGSLVVLAGLAANAFLARRPQDPARPATD